MPSVDQWLSARFYRSVQFRETPEAYSFAVKPKEVEGSSDWHLVFLPWNAGRHAQILLDNMEERHNKMGQSVVEYSPSPLLTEDPHEVLENFRHASHDVLADIQERTKDVKNPNLYIDAVSLGTVLGFLVVSRLPAGMVKGINLVVPGDDLATSLWTGVRTQHLREAYERKGFTQQSLEDLWKELAPVNNLDFLSMNTSQPPQINMWLGKTDKVIPYARGKALHKEIVNRIGNSNVTLHEKSLQGHYVTSGRAIKVL